MDIPFLASGAIVAAAHQRHQEQLRLSDNNYGRRRAVLLRCQSEELRLLALYPCFTSNSGIPLNRAWPSALSLSNVPIVAFVRKLNLHAEPVRHKHGMAFLRRRQEGMRVKRAVDALREVLEVPNMTHVEVLNETVEAIRQMRALLHADGTSVVLGETGR